MKSTGNLSPKKRKALKKKLRGVLSDEQLEKYLEYANSPESFAVLFVKKYLLNAKGCWIDILDLDENAHFLAEELEFRSVTCELFPRKIQPKYPPKKPDETNDEYLQICRAITWETAHLDINTQRMQGYKGSVYELTGGMLRKKVTRIEYRKRIFHPEDPLDDRYPTYACGETGTDPFPITEYQYQYRLRCIKRIK